MSHAAINHPIPHPMEDPAVCPKCGNALGFVCGTCIDCGWDRLKNEYAFIRIWAGDLKTIAHKFPDLVGRIIDQHDQEATRRRSSRFD